MTHPSQIRFPWLCSYTGCNNPATTHALREGNTDAMACNLHVPFLEPGTPQHAYHALCELVPWEECAA